MWYNKVVNDLAELPNFIAYYEAELQKRENEATEGNSEKADNGWGSQIRSYVLHPYQMVKDLRTQVETGNTQAVLDGDIDGFIEAGLAAKVGMTR